jgi:hypothetical protein
MFRVVHQTIRHRVSNRPGGQLAGLDQFVAVAAEILAGRAGMSADDPEPQIAAIAVLGLWRIQFRSLSRHLDGTRTPALRRLLTGYRRRRRAQTGGAACGRRIPKASSAAIP